MKLLGGISSQQQPVEDATPAQGVQPAEPEQAAPSATNEAPKQQGARNVMAEVIERHERISQRVKGK